MDLGTLLLGAVGGFIFAAIVLTPTGRKTTGRVVRATGERMERELRG